MVNVGAQAAQPSSVLSGMKLHCTGTILVVLAASACTTNKDAAAPLVRVRAEKDLKCPSDQIRVDSRIGGKYLASGCGKTATYNSACEGLRCSVTNEDEEAPAWRGRPDPDGTEFNR